MTLSGMAFCVPTRGAPQGGLALSATYSLLMGTPSRQASALMTTPCVGEPTVLTLRPRHRSAVCPVAPAGRGRLALACGDDVELADVPARCAGVQADADPSSAPVEAAEGMAGAHALQPRALVRGDGRVGAR